MASIPGIVIGAKVVPSDSTDTYPTHEDTYGLGGHKSVADLTERDNIPSARRKEGMYVYVISNNITYKLEGGITNSDWIQITEINGTQNQVAYFSNTGTLSGSPDLTYDGQNVFIHDNIPTNYSHFNNVVHTQGYIGFESVTCSNLTGDKTSGLALNAGSSLLSYIIETPKGLLYITDENLGNVYVVNPINMSLIETISSNISGNYTRAAVINPCNNHLYIANDVNITSGISDGTISILNFDTNSYTNSITLPDISGNGKISEMSFCPTNGYIYGTWESITNPYVFVINPSTNTFVTTIPVTSGKPWGVTFCPFNEKIFIGHVNTNSDYIDVIDPLTNTVESLIGPMELPQHGIYCPDTELLYFVGSYNKKIHVIDPRNYQKIDEINMSSEPDQRVVRHQSIFWNPNKKRLYSVAYGTGTANAGIRIFNPFTLRTEKIYNFGNEPENCKFALYSYHTGLTYVLNSYGGYLLPLL